MAHHFDIRIDKHEKCLSWGNWGKENGGIYIPQVIGHATGADLVDYTIRAAMGEDCSDLKVIEPEGYWSYYAVHSINSGILKEIVIGLRTLKEITSVESFMN